MRLDGREADYSKPRPAGSPALIIHNGRSHQPKSWSPSGSPPDPPFPHQPLTPRSSPLTRASCGSASAETFFVDQTRWSRMQEPGPQLGRVLLRRVATREACGCRRALLPIPTPSPPREPQDRRPHVRGVRVRIIKSSFMGERPTASALRAVPHATFLLTASSERSSSAFDHGWSTERRPWYATVDAGFGAAAVPSAVTAQRNAE